MYNCVWSSPFLSICFSLFRLFTADMGRLTYSTMCKHSDCVPFFLFLYLLLFSSGLVNIIKFVPNEKFKKIVEFLHSFCAGTFLVAAWKNGFSICILEKVGGPAWALTYACKWGRCVGLQGKCISWASRGSDDDHWQAHCCRHLLQLLPAACWLEICIAQLP